MSDRALGLVAVTGVLMLSVTGCLGHRNVRVVQSPLPSTSTASVSPAPTRTIVRSGQTIAAGDSADIQAQAGVSLRITASRPSVSRTRLSSDYGYPPAHGYYVTFMITVANTGSQPVDIGPSNFRVHIAGEGTVTSYDGNAPYSGASSQLDNTEVDPGQSDSGPLTFDVRSVHGTLSYLPDKSAAATWRF